MEQINTQPPDEIRNKILFENLTPLHPDSRFRLERENGSTEDLTRRVIDLIAPIGKGQRGLMRVGAENRQDCPATANCPVDYGDESGGRADGAVD